MISQNAIVAVFEHHQAAEDTVKRLADAGFDIKKLNIVGKGYHSEEKVVGFYNAGDRIRFWGRYGAFWGSLWGFFMGGLFMTLPVIGPREGKTILKFHTNQTVYAQGEVADAVFYIQKGRIKLTVLSDQGKEAVVAIMESGQFFGEGCMNGHPLRIGTTAAMEDAVVTSITKEAMIAVLHSSPNCSWRIC